MFSKNTTVKLTKYIIFKLYFELHFLLSDVLTNR